MSQTHKLKIQKAFADAIVSGDKNFEIRNNNDRGFQKGDIVIFYKVMTGPLSHEYAHEIYHRKYEITYVMSGYGLQEGYVVFGIKEVKKSETE